jgi:Tfp pilus assembly protein PilW
MRRNFQLKKGFTIMELVLYMGLFIILLTVLAQLFTAAIESQLSSQMFSYVQQDGRFILSRLQYDIENASSVTTPGAIGATSTSLAIVNNGTTYTYSLTGSNVLVNGIQLNGFNTAVSNLSFQKIGNSGGKPTVKLSFTITSLTKKNSIAEVKNFQTTAGLK